MHVKGKETVQYMQQFDIFVVPLIPVMGIIILADLESVVALASGNFKIGILICV